MDYQTLFNAALSIISIGLGWFLNTVYSATRSLQKDVVELERKIADDFVRKSDYKDDMRYIRDLLTQINNKLDSKQDK